MVLQTSFDLSTDSAIDTRASCWRDPEGGERRRVTIRGRGGGRYLAGVAPRDNGATTKANNRDRRLSEDGSPVEIGSYVVASVS